MYKLLKTVNKFNGNLAFVGSTDSGDMVFECDQQTGNLTYALSSKFISDICTYDADSYFIVFGDEWIGLYNSGILNENYIRLDLFIDQIVQSTEGEWYVLSRSENKLLKFTTLSVQSSSSSSSSSSSFSSSSSSSHK